MAIDPKDPDGDSTMTSSADSIRPDEDRTGARTPTAIAHASGAGGDAAELSPPGSQTHQESVSIGDIGTALDDRAGQPDKTSEQPGPAWQSKRAQEEYQRAMEFVVDKDFSLAEFGDPFDERDLTGTPFFTK
ncbi:uncharacterized protein N7515_003447 [Penicillium bovifimosum]|uniref:Uncharacterized protein n=1 Tax=Penicillium bovifimosum TaxID=126998 RepID=A0A9W9L5R5_9EURO|nr:uncharacterized protein N7515_003447 [Penicillium bovifimosum]KAJ5138599.1 hypothetical protein N7515_003447 [Penicillium bovifimosum]